VAKLTAALAAMSSERAQMQQKFESDRKKMKTELEAEVKELKLKLRIKGQYSSHSLYR